MTAVLEARDAVAAPAPADVLAAARDARAAADAAEAQVLLAACTWADLHPPESLADAAWADETGDAEVLLAGEGAHLWSRSTRWPSSPPPSDCRPAPATP